MVQTVVTLLELSEELPELRSLELRSELLELRFLERVEPEELVVTAGSAGGTGGVGGNGGQGNAGATLGGSGGNGGTLTTRWFRNVQPMWKYTAVGTYMAFRNRRSRRDLYGLPEPEKPEGLIWPSGTGEAGGTYMAFRNRRSRRKRIRLYLLVYINPFLCYSLIHYNAP